MYLQLFGAEVHKTRLGLYKLEPGRTAHGSPVWKQDGGGNRIARLSNSGWGVQRDDDVGEDKNLAWMTLTPPQKLEYPCDETTQPWQAIIGSDWKDQPGLKCQQAPVQAFIQLHGDVAESHKRRLGIYKLEPGRTAHGSPVWKQDDGDFRIARLASGKWAVQDDEDVGGQQGLAFLTLYTPSKLEYPCDETTQPWQAIINSEWKDQPELECVLS